MTQPNVHRCQKFLETGLVSCVAGFIGFASGANAQDHMLFSHFPLARDYVSEPVQRSSNEITETLNEFARSEDFFGLPLGQGPFLLIELLATGFIQGAVANLNNAISADHSVVAQAPSSLVFTSIFGFPLNGLWPTGVATWLGLQPGLRAQSFGTLDNRSGTSAVSFNILDGFRIEASFFQGGFGNLLGPLALRGDAVSVSMSQDGTGNLGFLGSIMGFAQSIGLRQLGTNVADIILLGYGEDNEVFVDQIGTGFAGVTVEGSSNQITVRQGYIFGAGGDNMVRIHVNGLENVLNVEQDGDNSLVVTIIGDANNALQNSPTALQNLGLSSGDVSQKGVGNKMTVKVQGYENVFGLSQAGGGSKSNVTMQGDFNTTAVLQVGQGGIVSVLQAGSSNSISVSQ